MVDAGPLRLTVAEVIDETEDARSLVFEPPAGFAYRPGQFLTLRVPSERCGSVARCYALCSSPHTGERPAVTVKRTADGYASNWLRDHVRPGVQKLRPLVRNLRPAARATAAASPELRR